MRRRLALVVGVLAAIMLLPLGAAAASTPAKDTFFICPSVSTHNAHGTWVLGAHGAYYVLVPTQGSGSKVYVTVPVSVPSTAQIPAGWALYKDVFTADASGNLVFDTNTAGSPVMLLSEGISTWLGSPAGWMEGQLATVTPSSGGGYDVVNIGNPMMGMPPPAITTVHVSYIPAASAAIW